MANKRSFWYWECIIHNCGSTKFNNLIRHETPWCEIVKKESKSEEKTGTWGGFHGDVSRKFLKDWLNYCRDKDLTKIQIEKYNAANIKEMEGMSMKKTTEYLLAIRELEEKWENGAT